MVSSELVDKVVRFMTDYKIGVILVLLVAVIAMAVHTGNMVKVVGKLKRAKERLMQSRAAPVLAPVAVPEPTVVPAATPAPAPVPVA